MADVNLAIVAGKVDWWQHWPPGQWGGTVAMRIHVDGTEGNDENGPWELSGGSVFVEARYKPQYKDSKSLQYILSMLEKGNVFATVSGGAIVEKTRKTGEIQRSIRTNLPSLRVYPYDPAQSSQTQESVNHVIVSGNGNYVDGGYLEVETKFKNPQKEGLDSRIVYVYSDNNVIDNMRGQKVCVIGKLAPKGFENEDELFVVADKIL